MIDDQTYYAEIRAIKARLDAIEERNKLIDITECRPMVNSVIGGGGPGGPTDVHQTKPLEGDFSSENKGD